MTTLRGLTWDHTRGWAPMAVTSQVFADHHPGCRLDWDRQTLWAFGEEGIEGIAQEYDLVVVDHPMVGSMAASGRFRPFPPEACSPAVGASAASYLLDGRQWALPIDAACQVSAVRPDLVARAGRPAPQSWEEVLDLAERTGRVAAPMTPIDVLSSLITLCGGAGRPVVGGVVAGADGGMGGRVNGGPDGGFLERAAAVAGLGVLRRLRAAVPDWCTATDPIAVLERMAGTDEVWFCPLVFGYTNYAREGYARHQVSFRDIPRLGDTPAAGSLLGGAGIAVTAEGRDPGLAARYARWVASAGVQRGEYLRAGGQPAAAAAWDDPAADLLTGGFFSATRAAVEAAVTRPRHVAYPAFQAEAALALHAWLLGPTESPTDVLDHVDAAYRASLPTSASRAVRGSDLLQREGHR